MRTHLHHTAWHWAMQWLNTNGAGVSAAVATVALVASVLTGLSTLRVLRQQAIYARQQGDAASSSLRLERQARATRAACLAKSVLPDLASMQFHLGSHYTAESLLRGVIERDNRPVLLRTWSGVGAGMNNRIDSNIYEMHHLGSEAGLTMMELITQAHLVDDLITPYSNPGLYKSQEEHLAAFNHWLVRSRALRQLVSRAQLQLEALSEMRAAWQQ